MLYRFPLNPRKGNAPFLRFLRPFLRPPSVDNWFLKIDLAVGFLNYARFGIENRLDPFENLFVNRLLPRKLRKPLAISCGFSLL
jgi:hypothetical protein